MRVLIFCLNLQVSLFYKLIFCYMVLLVNIFMFMKTFYQVQCTHHRFTAFDTRNLFWTLKKKQQILCSLFLITVVREYLNCPLEIRCQAFCYQICIKTFKRVDRNKIHPNAYMGNRTETFKQHADSTNVKVQTEKHAN